MKKLILHLSLILISTFTSADIDVPQPADLNFVEEKLLLDAIEAAQAAVRNAPDDANVWGYLGDVYLSHGWEIPAIPCYRQASQLAPNELRWHYLLGRLNKQHYPKESVEHLIRALALDSKYVPAHLYLASALRILGRLDEACHHLERAKQLQPDNPFSELWLGEIALSRQQIEAARAHLTRALRLNPGQSEAHALMAQIAIASGDTQAAQQHAQAARHPSEYSELADPLWWEVLQAGVTAPLYAERGRHYMARGNYARAVTEFAPLISDTQKDMKVWFDYGISLLHTERHADALAVLEQTLSLLHNDKAVQKERSTNEIAYLKAQVYNYMGQIYYEIGKMDAAIIRCQKALQFEPLLIRKKENTKMPSGSNSSDYATFFSNVRANLAMVNENKNYLEEAIFQYQRALELQPAKPSLHRSLAGVYWKKRRYAEAEPHYRQVIAHEARDVQAIYRLGLIFVMKNHYPEAITHFKKVIEIDATHVRAYGALGVTYQKIGHISEAIDTFEKVLELEPNNKVALDMLKQLYESK